MASPGGALLGSPTTRQATAMQREHERSTLALLRQVLAENKISAWYSALVAADLTSPRSMKQSRAVALLPVSEPDDWGTWWRALGASERQTLSMELGVHVDEAARGGVDGDLPEDSFVPDVGTDPGAFWAAVWTTINLVLSEDELFESVRREAYSSAVRPRALSFAADTPAGNSAPDCGSAKLKPTRIQFDAATMEELESRAAASLGAGARVRRCSFEQVKELWESARLARPRLPTYDKAASMARYEDSNGPPPVPRSRRTGAIKGPQPPATNSPSRQSFLTEHACVWEGVGVAFSFAMSDTGFEHYSYHRTDWLPGCGPTSAGSFERPSRDPDAPTRCRPAAGGDWVGVQMPLVRDHVLRVYEACTVPDPTTGRAASTYQTYELMRRCWAEIENALRTPADDGRLPNLSHVLSRLMTSHMFYRLPEDAPRYDPHRGDVSGRRAGPNAPGRSRAHGRLGGRSPRSPSRSRSRSAPRGRARRPARDRDRRRDDDSSSDDSSDEDSSDSSDSGDSRASASSGDAAESPRELASWTAAGLCHARCRQLLYGGRSCTRGAKGCRYEHPQDRSDLKAILRRSGRGGSSRGHAPRPRSPPKKDKKKKTKKGRRDH